MTWLFLIIYSLSALASLPSESSEYFKFSGKRNHYISYKRNRPTAIVILPGMTEPAAKYRELANDLDSLNTDIYMWDHIGQGESDYANDSIHPQMVYVDDYQKYIDPLVAFLKSIRGQYQQINIVAHSMGAHIALRSLIKDSSIMDKLVLNAPMASIYLYGVPRWLAETIVPWFWKKQDWCPFQGPYRQRTTKTSNVSTSEERLLSYHQLLISNPRLMRGGCSSGWLMASFRSLKQLEKFNDWSMIKQPVLMFFAGKEKFVQNNGGKEICRKMANCKEVDFPKSKHEILMESDDIRNRAVDALKKFLSLKIE